MTTDPFALAPSNEIADRKEPLRHRYGRDQNIVCDTDPLVIPKAEWEAQQNAPREKRQVSQELLTEIIVGLGDMIPLWEEGSILRWRFHDLSMQAFADPGTAKVAIEALFDEAVAEWGDACPVTFEKSDGRHDFEIVMRSQKRCSPYGCVLASAFFPDGGQHELVIYPSMFEQSREEQLETLVHEIGHMFGLRHYFALVKETDWAAVSYGEHTRFSIMNYGPDSKLTEADRADLQSLYEKVWSREITEIGGMRVETMRPFSAA